MPKPQKILACEGKVTLVINFLDHYILKISYWFKDEWQSHFVYTMSSKIKVDHGNARH